MPKLSRAEAEQRTKTLDGWTLEGDAVRKQYTFPTFPDAIAFVNRLAPKAEAADHHPDILINSNRSATASGGETRRGSTVVGVGRRLCDGLQS